MPDPGARAPRPRWRKWLLGVLLLGAALVAAANTYLIARAGPLTVASVELAPARPHAIVLGNRVFPGGVPSRELAARLETALALHQAGRVGKIVVSGLVTGNYDEPQAMAAWLEARGVPPAGIVVDGGGYRTSATMANASALGVRSALIVSQGYHLPRALYLARHAGIDALGVPAPARRSGWLDRLKPFVRETVARVEVLVEVAVRGVR